MTLRLADHVWNLRSERSYAVIHRALDAARRRKDSRIVHFGIQGEHAVRDGWTDPFSSAVAKAPRVAQLALFVEQVTSEPETWLLRRAAG